MSPLTLPSKIIISAHYFSSIRFSQSINHEKFILRDDVSNLRDVNGRDCDYDYDSCFGGYAHADGYA